MSRPIGAGKTDENKKIAYGSTGPDCTVQRAGVFCAGGSTGTQHRWGQYGAVLCIAGAAQRCGAGSGGPLRLADRPHRLPAHSGAVPADQSGGQGAAAGGLASAQSAAVCVGGCGGRAGGELGVRYTQRLPLPHPAAGAVPDPARSGGQLGDGGLPGQYRGVWGALPLGWAGAAAGGHHRGQRSGGGRSFPPAAGAALPGDTGAWGWGSCCVPGRWRH